MFVNRSITQPLKSNNKLRVVWWVNHKILWLGNFLFLSQKYWWSKTWYNYEFYCTLFLLEGPFPLTFPVVFSTLLKSFVVINQKLIASEFVLVGLIIFNFNGNWSVHYSIEKSFWWNSDFTEFIIRKFGGIPLKIPYRWNTKFRIPYSAGIRNSITKIRRNSIYLFSKIPTVFRNTELHWTFIVASSQHSFNHNVYSCRRM